MKKLIPYLFFLILLCSNVFTIISYLKLKKTTDQSIQYAEILAKGYAGLDQLFWRSLENSYGKISPIYVSFANDTLRTPITELLNNQRNIILRIKVNTCQKCVTDQIEAIKSFLKSSETNYASRIIVLVASKSNRDALAIQRSLPEAIRVLNVGTRMNLEAEDFDENYYFLIDRDLNVGMTYFPFNQSQEEILKYLDIVSKKLSI